MKNHICPSAILGSVKLGENIYIGNNSVIGTQPQYVGFNKKKILSTKFKNLIVSNNVVIMDLCHIHAGIKRNTKIGKNTMIMSGTHIGHDVQIGEGCNVSPNVAFAGEVILKNDVTIGMGATLHQGITIGSCSMIGMGAAVINNIPPFTTYAGIPAKKIKVNEIKLKRLGVGVNLINLIKDVMIKDMPIRKIKLRTKDKKYYKILEDWVKKNNIS
jgi:UDP-N-acetylglucosamine acyltransferase